MRRLTQRSHVLFLLAALTLLCGLAMPTFAAEEASSEIRAEESVGSAQHLDPAPESALDAAEWGGPEAPLMAAVRAEMESGSDCDSSQGYCSGPGPVCWSFCRALTGEIGFCSPIYNCCVCPEIRF